MGLESPRGGTSGEIFELRRGRVQGPDAGEGQAGVNAAAAKDELEGGMDSICD